MKELRRGAHTVSELKVHLVWSTKYRKKVLKGDLQKRCRDLIRQVCDANDVRILKGVISVDHVHLHVSYPAKLSISDLVRKVKGRSGRKLLSEYGDQLKSTYWGGHFWSIGYGAWSTGNITDKMIQEYLEHHGTPNKDDEAFILE